MPLLGHIVRLQIQRASLKRDANGRRSYDPAPLLAVRSLTLSRAGACAQLDDGSFALDVHHAAHPVTRHSGQNPLSFVFTSHYAAMRRQFGEHLAPGCAGENILIETATRVPLADVAAGLVIQSAHGAVPLRKVIVAAPCRPFSEYALAKSDATPLDLKVALQALDHGLRGYYGEFDGDSPATISLGDAVCWGEVP